MLEITSTFRIPVSEIELDFIRADGPGGQNVNKVATAVQLRFDVAHSASLPAEVKARLIKLAGRRVTQEGVLVIEARRYRSQEGNREDAIRRLSDLVRRALERPKVRKGTKPSRASQEERLREKKYRGKIKQSRSRQSLEDE